MVSLRDDFLSAPFTRLAPYASRMRDELNEVHRKRAGLEVCRYPACRRTSKRTGCTTGGGAIRQGKIPEGFATIAQRFNVGGFGRKKIAPVPKGRLNPRTHVLREFVLSLRLQHQGTAAHPLAFAPGTVVAVYGWNRAEKRDESHRDWGVEDHVHLLLSLPSTMPISKAMQLIKGGSSKWVHDTFPEHRLFQCQVKYGAFAVSVSLLDKTVAYIKGQPKHQ